MSYWKRRGIKQKQQSFFFGSVKGLILQNECLANVTQNYYNFTKNEKICGLYFSYRPTLMINDPVLVRNIMIKDFQYFHDRGIYVNEEVDPLSGHLFSLSGEKWKKLRAKLTPTFTSGKLKGMFPILLDCGKTLQNFISNKIVTGDDIIEIRDLLARFNTDIIASVAFGIEVDSVNNPNADFRIIGRKIFEANFRNGIRLVLNFFIPKLNSILNLKGTDKEVEDFMMKIVKENVEYREANNVKRNDFMELLIQLKNYGYCKSSEEESTDGSKLIENDVVKKLTLNELCAQTFVFFAAGFETSSTTMSYCLYELAKNPHIQKKLQQEIDEKISNNKISYEIINELKYLNLCVDETLRKYPPVPILNRETTKNYTIPDTNIVIEKGTSVIIPVYALHHDPQYFPNPEKFMPERFLEKINEDGNLIYLPFGDGKN